MSSILSVFGLRSFPFPSAKSLSPTTQGEHCDLIALLATLQQTSIPILPLMWHPALLPVGEGGFGAVTQAIQDVRTNFAFKRVREKKTSDRDGETTERAFRAIIAEVLVLGDERLRRHPYLAKLEGVCWEVENKTVWPVLVAEKAEHGDLRNFIIGQRGKQMPKSERYEMCFGIGNGVQALHAAGIVHGDLKPENVLIFPAANGQLVPRITDFGYSFISIGEDDLVMLPDSGIWAAPECEGRGCLLHDAKKIDCFGTQEKPIQAVWSALLNDASKEVHQEFQFCKIRGTISEMAVELVHSQQGLSDAERAGLCDLLRKTLSLEKTHRELGIINFRILVPGNNIEPSSGFDKDCATSRATCEDFQLAQLMPQLSLSEYTVRSAVVQRFQEMTLESSCPICVQGCIPNACFQLALCYRLGFGVEQDHRKSLSWLQQSGRNELDMANVLDGIKEISGETELGIGLFKELWASGHIRTLNFAQDYRERGVLEEAKEAHAMEVVDVQGVLGQTNIITIYLKSVLSSILRDDRCWAEAEKIELQILDARVKSSGIDHPDSLLSMRNMLSIQQNLGRLEEAERMGRALVPAMEQVFGRTHTDTLTIMGDLATILLARGNLKEAEELYLAVAEIERLESGADHPDSVITLANLAMVYKDQGRLGDAQNAGTVAANLFERVLGSEHPSTLTAKSNLAAIFVEQGRYSEAANVADRVLKVRRTLLGTEHPQTLFSIRILASCKMGLERYAEAEMDLAEVLKAQQYELGEQNPVAIDTMSVLATAVSAQGRVEEAERLEQKVVELSKRSLGDSHLDTLLRMANLAVTYADQERWQEAEKLQVAVIEKLTASQGPENPTVLKTKGNLAQTYRAQKRMEEAEVVAREGWQGLMHVLGSEHPSTQKSMMVLMSILVSQGRIQEANDLGQQVGAPSGR